MPSKGIVTEHDIFVIKTLERKRHTSTSASERRDLRVEMERIAAECKARKPKPDFFKAAKAKIIRVVIGSDICLN